jgi:hypothetical protein
MDHGELSRLLGEFESENDGVLRQITALQSRSSALIRAADGIRALLEVAPESVGSASRLATVPLPSSAAAVVADVREAENRVPADHEQVPKGKGAAKLVLESDTSRFWTVRDVHDEEVRRGWAEYRAPGASGNPPARAALQRLQEDHPDNVEVQEAPVLAYKWVPNRLPSINGSGASHP